MVDQAKLTDLLTLLYHASYWDGHTADAPDTTGCGVCQAMTKIKEALPDIDADLIQQRLK